MTNEQKIITTRAGINVLQACKATTAFEAAPYNFEMCIQNSTASMPEFSCSRHTGLEKGPV
jgi:hypothetical protein